MDELNQKYHGGRLMRAWKDIIEHGNYDECWQRRDFLRQLDRVRVPVLNVAAWFRPARPYGTIATYETIEREDPANRSILVVGPWRHGGWHRDEIEFGVKTTRFYQEKIVFPFFQHHLKDEGAGYAREVTAFKTGRNRWRTFGQWPPLAVETQKLYLHADRTAPASPSCMTGTSSLPRATDLRI